MVSGIIHITYHCLTFLEVFQLGKIKIHRCYRVDHKETLRIEKSQEEVHLAISWNTFVLNEVMPSQEHETSKAHLPTISDVRDSYSTKCLLSTCHPSWMDWETNMVQEFFVNMA